MKLYTAKANLLLFNILFITENFPTKTFTIKKKTATTTSKNSLVFQWKNFSVQYFSTED